MANEFNRRRQDADVNPAAKALPASAAGTEVTASIDLDDNTNAHIDDSVELEITSPVLDATELPDGETVTYKIEGSTDDISFSDVCASALVVTGAGGVGAAKTTKRVGIASDGVQFIRGSATSSASAGDQSGSDFEIAAIF